MERIMKICGWYYLLCYCILPFQEEANKQWGHSWFYSHRHGVEVAILLLMKDPEPKVVQDERLIQNCMEHKEPECTYKTNMIRLT